MTPIFVTRGSRASFNSLVSAASLTTGQLFFIEDEGRLVVATGSAASVDVARKSELPSNTGFMSRFVANAGQTAFTMSNAVTTPNSVIVTQNGQRLDPAADYTVSGTSLALTANAIVSANDIIIAEMPGGNQGAPGAIGPAGLGVPAGGISGQLLLKQSNATGDYGFASIGAGLTYANSVLSASVSSSIPASDVQVFNSSATWTKPAGAKSVYIWVCSGGSGGGGGGGASSGSQGNGGSGGAPGVVCEITIPATALTATVAVTVGAGGAAGGGTNNGSSYGYTGGAGGKSSFGPFLSTINPMFSSNVVGPGGGGYGGYGSSSYSSGGGDGIQGSTRRGTVSKAGAGGASPPNYQSNPGGDAVADIAATETNCGSGGGGGSGSYNSGGAGNGGQGSAPGGGGGGGGGGCSAAGAYGGYGAPGRVVVVTFF